MDSVYHWVGFAVVWGLVAAALAGAWVFRPRNRFTRELDDVAEWVAVRVFRKDFDMPIEGARLLFTVDRPHKWPRWKRNILATSIRRARRNGFKDPYA